MIRNLLAAVRRNLGYKLLSLGISILLYLVASSQSNPQATTRAVVQPEVVHLPRHLAHVPGPGSVTVALTGPANLVDEARTKIQATAEGAGARPGKIFLPVSYALPPDIAGLVQIDGPATVEATIETKVERQVPVQVLYDQSATPPGYEFRAPVIRPDHVTVIGLERDVSKVAQVVALLDNADDTGSAIDRDVPIVAQDDRKQEMRAVELRPTRVKVMLGLRKVPASKTLVLSAEIQGFPAPGYQLIGYRFDPPTVVVRGESAALAGLSAIRVPVAIDGLSTPQVQQVPINAPAGGALARPVTASLTLDIRPIGVVASPRPTPTPPKPTPTPTPTAPRPTPTPTPPARGDND